MLHECVHLSELTVHLRSVYYTLNQLAIFNATPSTPPKSKSYDPDHLDPLPSSDT